MPCSRLRFPALILLGAAALLAASGAPRADDTHPRDRAAVTLLQLNDVYTAMPVDGGKAGGLARVASLKKKLAAEGRTPVMTLGGDFLSPSIASSVFKGRQMVDALNACGLDIATIGNHEFDFGPDVMRQRMREAKFSWVVSNVVDEATGLPVGGAATYLIRKYGGLTIGYLGLCLGGEEISKDRRQGIRIEDPFVAAQRTLRVLQAKGVNVIVALTHLDFADDRRLALRYPQIDVILGGHEHFPIVAHVGKTLIVKAGSDGRFVGRVDLHQSAPKAPIEKHFEMIPIGPELPDDPNTLRVALDYESRLGKELEVEVGATETPLNAVAESVRAGESNLGNLLADAMRVDVKAEVAILNAGSIRSNRVYPPGKLLRRDVVAVHPFGGTVCKLEARGSVILAALNHGVGRLGESVGRFPQVSGITFRVDPAAPAGNRIREAKVGGQPLDPARVYSLAVGDYMLRGGDGYTMLAAAKVVVGPESGNTLADVLERHIRATGKVAPVVEGRIVIARGAPPVAARRPLILDTDMGIDSVLGLLYLLKDPGVSLKAVTIANGVAEVQAGGENARRILELTGNRAIPVAVGPAGPLQGQRAFPAFWREQANTLGGAKLPAAVAPLRPEGAVDLLLAELERSPEPVTLVAMGPLTNIALALRKRPEAARKIRELVAMGGAVTGPGNVDRPFVGIKNSAAEWNFYLDPHAAREVLASGIAVRLIPLEATRSLPVTPAFLNRVRQAPRDEASGLLLALLEAVSNGIEGGWYFFWDALAAVAAAHPEVMGSHEATLTVVTDDGPTLGQTRPDPSGRPVRLGEEVNLTAFEDRLLAALLR
jgi:5'-nucleotidase